MTVSTSRFKARRAGREADDESGDLAEEAIRGSGGEVVGRELVPDDAARIRRVLAGALKRRDLDAVVTTGGTGISTTDVTIETARPLFEKEIEGFGEVFRWASYQRVGAAAALSRATAGVARGKLLVCVPGSPDAVRTALGLFLQEVPHVLHLARGQREPS